MQGKADVRILNVLFYLLILWCAIFTLSGCDFSKTSVLISTSPSLKLIIEANRDSARLTKLGWDTEGTGRETINLLKSPVKLLLSKNNQHLNPKLASERVDAQSIAYNLLLPGNKQLTWKISAGDGELRMHFSGSDDLSSDIDKIELVFPFNPKKTCTSIISSNWTPAGEFKLPVIVSAPDIGQLLLTTEEKGEIIGYTIGNRAEGWVDIKIGLPVPDKKSATTLKFTPVVLPVPAGYKDVKRWTASRRGWFNQIQQSCGASGGGRDVAGVWANNVLSDPVSSVLYMLGDATILVPELAPDVTMPPILRQTVEYFIDHRTSANGLVAYVAGGSNAAEEESGDPAPNDKDFDAGLHQNLMDSNPAVLIGAWSYVKASADYDWLKKRIKDLELVARYMQNRDIDGDGLIESKQSGNSGSQPPRSPDMAWDCYVSGHKNAYVNELAYRAFNNMADLEKILGENKKEEIYRQQATKIKGIFLKTFYNPETGWLGWWRSRDGKLHDIYSDVPTSLAISYGIIGKDEGKAMLQRFWKALEATGFKQFDVGIPVNLRPVPKEELGLFLEFQQFLNGGCCVSNTSYLLDALYIVGMTQQADMILDAMIKRQKEGVFRNGGGFQNGFVDRFGFGAEVFDWNGAPAGYEGHLVYCWSFLHSMLRKEIVAQY